MNNIFKPILDDDRSRILVECFDRKIYAVGGAVRDCILGRKFKDIDYTIGLHPDEILKILTEKGYRVIPTGNSHQTVTVVLGENIQPLEVTSFRNSEMRSEGGVFLGESIEEDLKFRDFTCNSLAVDLQTGVLIDVLNSVEDIKKRLLKGNIDAAQRFKEDPLRILRMIRIASELNFSIDDSTFAQGIALAPLLKNVSMERIRDEFSKIIVTEKVEFGLEKLREISFFDLFFPELKVCVGFEQNKFHSKDVYYHTIDVLELSKPTLLNRLAALLHDIGKPDSLTVDEGGDRHFYLHEKIGAEMVEPILKRFMYSKNIIKSVERLVYTHMRPIDAGAGGLRRILRDTEPNYLEWRDLKQADTIAVLGDGVKIKNEFADFDNRIHEILNSPTGSVFKNLAVNGLDLKELKIKEGPIYKEILKYCQELVIDNPSLNTKSQLIEAIRIRFLAKKSNL